MADRELAACPFCGGAPKSYWQGDSSEAGDDGYWAIEHCDVFVHRCDEAEAILAWNRRPPADPDNEGLAGEVDPNALTEVLVPMDFERPIGTSLEEWRENVHKTDLCKRGDTVLVWVNEGDICHGPWGPFVKRLLKPHEIAALATAPRATEADTARAEVERRFKMQGGPMIPWSLAETIYDAYSALYGTQQSLERLHERGGFGWEEVKVIFAELRMRKTEKWSAIHERDRAAIRARTLSDGASNVDRGVMP